MKAKKIIMKISPVMENVSSAIQHIVSTPNHLSKLLC